MNEENQSQKFAIEEDPHQEESELDYTSSADDDKSKMLVLSEQLADLIVEKLLANTESNRLLASARENDRRNREGDNRENRGKSDRRNCTRRPSPVTFEDLVSREMPNLFLSAEYKFIEDYLRGLVIVNDELCEDFSFEEGFPIKHSPIEINLLSPLHRLLTNDPIFRTYNLELLYRIEKFMLVLAVEQLPAFIEEPAANERVELDKKITSIGKEFLFLLSQYKTISLFDHEYLTTAVTIFRNFIQDNLKEQQRCPFSLNTDISHKSIRELNNLLFSLRRSWIQGRYDQKFQHYHWTQHRGIQYRDFSELKKNLKSLFSRVEKDRNRLAQYKNNHIAIYRFQIEIFCDGQSVRYEFFGKFFTALIKAAKQSSDLPGLLDYISIWKEMDQGTLQADTVLFFSAKQQTVFKDRINQFPVIGKGFQKFADGLLKKEIAKLQDANAQEKKWEIIVRQVTVLRNFSNEMNWLLEANSPQWKIVNTQLIPYFYLMDSYEREYLDGISLRTSTGRSSNKEAKP